MKQFGLIFVAMLSVVAVSVNDCEATSSASDMMIEIYESCLSQYSIGCVKPKALSWISKAISSREIKITDDLSIIKTGNEDPIDFHQQKRSGDPRVELFDKIDSFLASHSIRISAPSILKTEEARAFVGDQDLEQMIELPLAEGNVAEGIHHTF